jgi:FkbM family methyltransferase
MADDSGFDLARELAVPPHAISIVDVGAAFYGEPALYGPLMTAKLARLVGFEPDTARCEAWGGEADLHTRILPYALGDGVPHPMYQAPLGMTSLLEPNPASYGFYTPFAQAPFWPVSPGPSRWIETKRLDDVHELDRIDFLKIDVQGMELVVLQNGREKLQDCSVVQIEMPFVRLYKGQPNFGDLDAELSRQGFMVHGFASLKRLPIAPYAVGGVSAGINQLVDFDMIYIRDLIHPERVTNRQLALTAVIADVCYASYDLALRCTLTLAQRGQCGAELPRRYLESLAGRSRRVFQPPA